MRSTRIAAAVLPVFAATPAAAAGFGLEEQNAAAAGSAYAGAEAHEGDAGFAHYNPAALAKIQGVDFSANFTFLAADSDYLNANSVVLGAFPAGGLGADGDALANVYLPSLAIGWRATERLSLGLSLNAPFGLNSHYETDSAIRYFALDTKIKVLSIAPAAAFSLGDRVSVGGALRIHYLDFNAGNAIDAAGILAANMVPGFAPGTDDVFVSLDGDDIAIGYQLGVQAEPAPGMRIGINFSSKVRHKFDGAAKFDIQSSLAGQTLNAVFGLFEDTRFTSALSTPASVSAGIEQDFGDRFTLKASAGATFWKSFDEVQVTFDNPAQPPELLTQAWKNSITVSLGGDLKASESTTLRAGVMFDESPVNPTYASPRIQDDDRLWVTAGLSQQLRRNVALDLAAGYVFVSGRHIDQPASRPENLFRGSLTADIDSNVLLLSARLRISTN